MDTDRNHELGPSCRGVLDEHRAHPVLRRPTIAIITCIPPRNGVILTPHSPPVMDLRQLEDTLFETVETTVCIKDTYLKTYNNAHMSPVIAPTTPGRKSEKKRLSGQPAYATPQ